MRTLSKFHSNPSILTWMKGKWKWSRHYYACTAKLKFKQWLVFTQPKKSATEIHKKIEEVYGKNFLLVQMVRRWQKQFIERRQHDRREHATSIKTEPITESADRTTVEKRMFVIGTQVMATSFFICISVTHVKFDGLLWNFDNVCINSRNWCPNFLKISFLDPFTVF